MPAARTAVHTKIPCYFFRPMKPTSIICGIRNRNQILAQMLPNWLNFPVQEIVIVDLRDNGCECAWDVVKNIQDSRVKVFQTNYEYRWSHGIACNLGISMAQHPYILKLDVDYELRRDFFEQNVPEENTFIQKWSNQNTGLFYLKKSMWAAINGFDEDMPFWGHNDIDFRDRLVAAGFKRKDWVRGSFRHKPHSMDMRATQFSRKIQGNTWDMLLRVAKFQEFLSLHSPWSPEAMRIRWVISKVSDRMFLAERDV